MARHTAGVDNQKGDYLSTKRDIKQEVTNRIVELLESGAGKWSKTWSAPDLPVNAITGKPYNGVNILILWADSVGFKSNRWLTYKQAQSVGAQVRRGEKSSTCVYFEMAMKKKASPTDEDEFYPMARTFNLFNIDQVDNLPAEYLSTEAVREFNPISEAAKILDNSKAVINHGGDKAFYRFSDDSITLPHAEQFLSTESYYATALHELVHWSGASTRLDRKRAKKFGDDAYAFEELIAELGSAFLMSHLGLVGATIENHASYLQSWLKVLKADKNAIFTAASQASKAYEYIINL